MMSYCGDHLIIVNDGVYSVFLVNDGGYPVFLVNDGVYPVFGGKPDNAGQAHAVNVR
jgi:hypothetical protein